ncbi:MAG: porin [bacterium]
MVSRKFFGAALSALILAGFLSFSSSGLAEKVKNGTPQPEERSGRRRPYSSFSEAGESLSKYDTRDNKAKPEQEGDAKIEVGVVLAWDYSSYTGAHIEDSSQHKDKGHHWRGESELRRASLDVKSKLNKDWQAEMKVSFSNDEEPATEIEDAYMEFSGWDHGDLIIGQAKEPFGLEGLASSEDTITIERSMATSAFAPGRNPGLRLSGAIRKFTWAAGVYEALDREDKRDTYALTGRLTIAPWQHKTRVLHLGLAGSVRDFGGEKYQIQERAEVHAAEKSVTGIETLADKVNLMGLEAAWVSGPISLQAEYMAVSVEADIGDDAAYKGYYLLGSYCLTGESRAYKKGTFDSIKPRARYGAFELVVRSSVLDASIPLSSKIPLPASGRENNDHSRAGVKAASLTLGMNYYFNRQVRLMLNSIHTNLSGNVSKDEDNASAVSFRAQYSH